MKLFFDRVIYYAQFYDDSGKPIALIKILKKEFQYKHNNITGSYVFKPECKSFVKLPMYQGPILTGFMKIFHYNINNPEPVEIVRDYQPSFTSEDFNIMITSRKLTEMNDLANDENMLLKLLKSPIFWIMSLLVIGFVWYLSSHNWKLW